MSKNNHFSHNIQNMMDNMLEVKAKQEMRATNFGKELDDLCTAAEQLVQKATPDQLAQIARMGGEITRIANRQKEILEEEEEEEEEEGEDPFA